MAKTWEDRLNKKGISIPEAVENNFWIDVQESIDEIQDILAEVDELLLTSELPEEVDEELINLMVLRTLDEFSL